MPQKRLRLLCVICALLNACAQRSPITTVALSPGVYKIQVEGDASLTLAELQQKIADKALMLCGDAGFSYQSLLDLQLEPLTTYRENNMNNAQVTVLSRLIACDLGK